MYNLSRATSEIEVVFFIVEKGKIWYNMKKMEKEGRKMDEANPFKFLKEKEKTLYLQFTESWKNYKTDFIYANDKLRTGMLKFAEEMIKEEKEEDIKLTNKQKIKRLIQKGILPNKEQFSELIEKRNKIEYEGSWVERKDLKRYEEVMNAVYKALYQKYEKRLPEQELNYNRFPIKDYQIIQYKKTEFLGKEQVEYLAIKENQYKIKETCIIREYDATKQRLFHHEQTVAMLLRGETKKEVTNLMKMIEIETKENNPYRYIGYIVDENMKKLSEIAIEKLGNKQKIAIIKDIINGVEELGMVTNYKINHRNLNPENIYMVLTQKNQVTTKLGNFELTKIEMSQEEYESAYQYIKKQYTEQNFSCYYPRTGWEKSRTYEEWEKVDVYSIGKIIEWICFQKVIPNKYLIEDFKKQGYPAKLGEIYGKMVSQMADRRPAIKEIKQEIEEIQGGYQFWKKRI
ncbi:MAG: hypothetical protein HFJ33_00740 [Clostridia bacterium]|nr:hypothetical protein [Clostridia bacterium]